MIDSAGRFEFERPGLVPDGVALVARGLETGSEWPTSVSFLDELDRLVPAGHPGGGHTKLTRVDLHEGRSGVIAVDKNARTAILSRGGVDVNRVQIEPSDHLVTILQSPGRGARATCRPRLTAAPVGASSIGLGLKQGTTPGR